MVKSKKEIQKNLNKNNLKTWVFKNPKSSVAIVSETAKLLTKDPRLQSDLIKYHSELLDRRYSGTIELFGQNGQLAIKVELHGFDPQVILLLQEYIEFSLFDKTYLSEEKLKQWLNEKKVNVERLYVKNYEDLETVKDVNYNVNFY